MTSAELDGQRRPHLASLRRRAHQLHARQGRKGRGGRSDRGADDPRRLDVCARRRLARSELEARRHRSRLTRLPLSSREPAWITLRLSADRRTGRSHPSRNFAFPTFPAGATTITPRRFAAFLAGARADRGRLRRRPARSASTAKDLQAIATRLLADPPASGRDAARKFFEQHFVPHPDRGARASSPAITSRRLRRAACGPSAFACRSIAVRPISSKSRTRTAAGLGSGDALRATNRERHRALLRSRRDRGRRARRAGAGACLRRRPGRRFLHPRAGIGAAEARDGPDRGRRCGSPSTARAGTATPRSAGSRSSAASCRSRKPTRMGSKHG